MDKHAHASCEHLVAWCRHCDVVFCKNPGCDMEWAPPCTRPHHLGLSGQPWLLPHDPFNVIPMASRMANGVVEGSIPDLDPYQKPGHQHAVPWAE